MPDITADRAFRLGWSIIPTKRDKKPLYSWKEFITARPTEAQFREWLRRNPPAWAVIGGAVSGLIIIDFDGEPGVALASRWGVKPHVRTPSGGYHLYIAHPGWRVQTLNSRAKHELGARYPGLDIRADGGYALFCGSTDKGEYRWLRSPDLDPISVIPADAAAFLGLLDPPGSAQPQQARTPAPERPLHPRRGHHEFDWVRWALERIAAYGGRNNTGYQLAMQLRDNGFAESDAAGVLREFVRACPDTDAHGQRAPYTDTEAEASLRKAYQAAPRQPWESRAAAKGAPERRSRAAAPAPDGDSPAQPKDETAPTPEASGDAPPPDGDDGKPEIYQGWQLSRAMDEVWTHLHARNGRIIASATVERGSEPLFLSPDGSSLVRLVWRENADGDRTLCIEQMGEHRVAGLLTREFDWKTQTKDGDRNRDPKKAVIQQVAGDAASNPVGTLPYLHAVASTPLFGRGGALITAPGYHASERLWMQPSACIAAMPPVPDLPDLADVDAARAMILIELFGDFPFAGEAERATAVAMLLQPFMRRMIDGPAPLYLVEAPVQGVGKTRLCQLCAIVATGAAAPPITWSFNEDESRKALAASLLAGAPLAIIDNVDTSRAVLHSPTLSSIATSTTFKDRKLGFSEMMELNNRCTWMLTGNNVRIGEDLVRRFVRCRLVARSERPELLPPESFRHPDIEGWARENRGALVHACLTLIRAWLAFGAAARPKARRIVGSYEQWSAAMGGVMEAIGLGEAFLGNIDQLRAASDVETSSMEAFVAAWWCDAMKDDGDHGEHRRISELRRFASERGLLGSVLGDGGEQSQITRLGRALKTNTDKLFGIEPQGDGGPHLTVRLRGRLNAATKNNEYWLEEERCRP